MSPVEWVRFGTDLLQTIGIILVTVALMIHIRASRRYWKK